MRAFCALAAGILILGSAWPGGAKFQEGAYSGPASARFLRHPEAVLRLPEEDPCSSSRYSARDLLDIVRDFTRHGSRSSQEMRLALRALVPSERAAVDLVAILEREDETVVTWLGQILSRRSDVALPRLLRRALNGERRARIAALQALASFVEDAERLVPEIAPLANDADPEVRAWAAFTLGRMGWRGREHVLALCAHADARVREAAFEALEKSCMLGLGRMLYGQAPGAATAAILRRRQVELAAGLQDESPRVRAACALLFLKLAVEGSASMGARGWPPGLEAQLFAATLDSEPSVAMCATAALATVGSGERELLLDLRAALRRPNGSAGSTWMDAAAPESRPLRAWWRDETPETSARVEPHARRERFSRACAVAMRADTCLQSREAWNARPENARSALRASAAIVRRHIEQLAHEASQLEPDVAEPAARELAALYPASAHILAHALLNPALPPRRDQNLPLLWILEQAGASALPTLTLALDHSDAATRHGAARAISNLGAQGEPAIPFLISAWRSSGRPFGTDPAWDAPEHAALSRAHGFPRGHTFAGFGPVSLPHMATALADSHAAVRARACAALASLGVSAAPVKQQLAALLRDPQRCVRVAAAQALLAGAAAGDGQLETIARELLQREN